MLSLDPKIAYLKEVKILLLWLIEKFLTSSEQKMSYIFIFFSQGEINITKVLWGEGGGWTFYFKHIIFNTFLGRFLLYRN